MKTDHKPSTWFRIVRLRSAVGASFTVPGPAAMDPFHIYLYGPQQGPIEASFEDAESRLTQLPQLHFEPDGSFVWVRDGGREQVAGTIYDADGRIRYCDLQGMCARSTWRQLCQAITGGAQEGIEVLRLPEQVLQDLQSFEATCLIDFGPPPG